MDTTGDTMALFPDPFSDDLIEAELPFAEPLRGLPADDAYWNAMLEPMRPRQHDLTRAEMRQVA